MSACGSYAGYQSHRLRGEQACRPCKDALTRYHRDYRQRGKCAPGLGWPLGPGDVAPVKPNEIAYAERGRQWARRRRGES